MGREVVVPVNIFSRSDIFLGGVEIFLGGVVEKFLRGSHVGTPPRKFIIIFLKTEEVQNKRMGDDTC